MVFIPRNIPNYSFVYLNCDIETLEGTFTKDHHMKIVEIIDNKVSLIDAEGNKLNNVSFCKLNFTYNKF